MKKRILFVDDEPLILEGLQRMLRSLREEWDMEFVESGAKALERMAQTPFDAVVSDMRMPGMNGAEFLNQVMRRFPHTVRFILSGHADQELILKSVGSTHQYLSKPCDPEALKSAVHRACSLGGVLHNPQLRSMVAKMDRLPSLPSIYTQVVEMLQDPEVSAEQIAEVIAKDIGMTAKILKLVNSAFFGLCQHIANLNEAVSYLGVGTIKTLALCVNAFSQYADAKSGPINMEAVWSHSLATAAAAKAICGMEDASNAMLEQAFIGGMLHDTGKLILSCNYPMEYQEIMMDARKNHTEIATAELKILGGTHAAVGGYLLGLWGLPVPVVEAIALHHQPGDSTEQVFSPLTAVHAANVFLQPSAVSTQGIQPCALDLKYLEGIGLSSRIEAWKNTIPTK